MWIRNFDLDDFGCFQRSRLLDLEDGLVVICGPQRAGKTTYMHAMRKLGYGISTGDDLPPPTQEYRLAADIVYDGIDCDISVSGFAEPRLFSDEGSVRLEDVYGAVTADQYRQLFTISLDQLRRTPPGISERKELSAILLGAGYGDIAQVPELKSDFSSEAETIGGKHGRAVYRLKDPVQTIEQGIEARSEAKDHVDEHQTKRGELEEVNSRIQENQESKTELDRKKDRLTVLEATYEDFEEYRRLDRELDETDEERVEHFPLEELDRAMRLADSYESARSELADAASEFQRTADVEDIDSHRASLLEIGSHIERYERQISGWRTQIENIEDRQSELREEWDELSHRAASLNGEWEANPESALDISLDSLTEDAVVQITDEFETAQQRFSEASEELEQERAKLEETKRQLEEATGESGGATEARDAVVRFAGLSLMGIVVGALVGLAVAPIWGLVVTAFLVGLATTYAYLSLLRGDLLVGDTPVSELRTEKNRMEAEISSIESRIRSAREDKEQAEEELDDLRGALCIPTDVTAEGVRAYYRDLDRLHNDLRAATAEEEAIDEERTELRRELREVHATVEPIVDVSEDDLLESAEELFDAIESASVELEQARIVEKHRNEVERTESKILDVLSEWDELDVTDDAADIDGSLEEALDSFVQTGEAVQQLAADMEIHSELESRLHNRFDRQAVRAAFAPIYQELPESEVDPDVEPEDVPVERIVDAAGHVADQYVDERAIQDALDRIDTELERLDAERQELLEDRTELESELEDLASDEDIVEAQDTIERGRQQLRPLAERYAEYRIAEYLVDELHERFIEEATGPLLDDATELFEHITNEYTDVNHTGSLDDLDFEAIRADGTVYASTELSRATAEQLFLAVRIARIQQLDVSLPVVLDDSMTNFDPQHLARTLDLIEELADTNQVFFLTCHPNFIEKAAERTAVEQFWTLDDGTFDGPFDETEPLISRLNGT